MSKSYGSGPVHGKNMMDRKMGGMKDGKPMSEAFFPEGSKRMELKKCGGPAPYKYPDTQEEVYMAQEHNLAAQKRGKQKEGYRY